METMRMGLFLALAALAFGCTSTTGGDGDGDADIDADTDADTDVDSDSDSDADTDADTDSDTACDLMSDTGEGCGSGECCYMNESEDGYCEAGGVAEQGDTCEVQQDCGCGYTCLVTTTCAHWCAIGNGVIGSDDACPAPAICTISLLSATPGETVGMVCKIPDLCNVFTQNCENPADGCYVIRTDGRTDCAEAGDAVQPDACTFANDCAAGYACDGANCVKFCNPTTGDPGCDIGTCEAQPYDVQGGTDPVGLCTGA